MPLATLLNPDDPLFEFEHMMQHRQYFAVMSPLSRFSELPYLLEPSWGTSVPAGEWHQAHQQAHDDIKHELPAHWQSPAVGFGVPVVQNLIDSNLADDESRTWWTFLNHQEHYIANEAILPLPTTVNPSPEPITDPVDPPWWRELGPAKYPFW